MSPKSRQQYEWAAKHIRKGLGGIPLDRLTRDDVARWIDGMAAGGVYARRSIQIFRMVLRAGAGRGRRRGPPAPLAGGPGRHAPGRREGRPGARGAGVDRGRRPHVPRRRSRTTAGTARSASTCSTACAAPSSSDCKWGDIDLKAGTVRVERGLDRGGRRADVDRRQERPLPPHDPDRPDDGPAPRRPPPPPGRGTPRRRRHVGRQRPPRGEPDRHRRVARQLRPDARAARAPGRRAPADVARPPPHGGDAHGPPRQRHRRDPRRRRPPRPQPRHADAHLRPRPAGVGRARSPTRSPSAAPTSDRSRYRIARMLSARYGSRSSCGYAS